MFISHYHGPEDGFSNLEEGSEWIEDDRASLSSVVHRSAVQSSNGRASLFAPDVSDTPWTVAWMLTWHRKFEH